MRPIWFRLSLASLAICSAAFALVDQSLRFFDGGSQATRALAAAFDAPSKAATVLKQLQPLPPKAKRSLFVASDEVGRSSPRDEAEIVSADPVLRGVVIADGHPKALIATGPEATGDWVEVGDATAGSSVEVIEPRRVFLRRGADGFWISLTPIGG